MAETEEKPYEITIRGTTEKPDTTKSMAEQFAKRLLDSGASIRVAEVYVEGRKVDVAPKEDDER